ncbi:MAG: ACT domain-containing protein [Anaerolineales bacterium]|nr:ACT domain-containing protein [Anaerolineales bacterium]
MNLKLEVLQWQLAICRLDPGDPIPQWALECPFFSVTRTPEELSILCCEDSIPPEIQHEGGWRGMKVQGPLPFTLTGVISSLSDPLAEAGIPIFVLSTFDTDYVLVKWIDLDRAVIVLREEGHEVESGIGDIGD